MNKLWTAGFFTVLIICILATIAMAAGSVTVKEDNAYPDVDIITFTWTADAADGSIPNTTSSGYYPDGRRGKVGYVSLVTTTPGTPAPTDNYDIALLDEDGVDIMGNSLDDRDTANPEQATPKIGTVYGGRIMPGIMNLVISGNSVNSATGTVKVIIAY
jgi:hypothetical protein